MTIIQAKACNRYPGDQLCRMTAEHTDEAGVVHPKGTLYTPLSSGLANNKPGIPAYQTVTIAGAKVTFYGPRRH